MNRSIARVLGFYKCLKSTYFGALLGNAEILHIEKDLISFQYNVPADVCINNKMPCSVALAVFDELSTIGFMALDKQRRPGVSLFLTTRISDTVVRSGETLTVNIKYDKVRQRCACVVLLNMLVWVHHYWVNG